MDKYTIVLSNTKDVTLRKRIKALFLELGVTSKKSSASRITSVDERAKARKKRQQANFKKNQAKRAKQAESFRKKYRLKK